MKYPIRVLQVFSRMDRGGSESIIMNFYRNIDRSKVQFDFVVHTNEKCAFDEEIEALGGKIHRMPRYNGKNHFLYLLRWKKFLQEHNEYKVIHGHYFTISAIYFWMARKYNRICVAHSHSDYNNKGIKILQYKKLLTFPIRFIANYLFACSKSTGLWLYGQRSLEKKKFFILKNAIDSEKFTFDSKIREQKREELNISDKFVLGHVGSFSIAKNHDFLIDVFKKVHNKNKQAVLLLIGDGFLRSSIEEKVKELGLSGSVIFTGIRSDISDLLQAVDLFVFPSLFEGLPVSVIEAQAAGLPCLISDTITEEVIVTNLVESLSIDEIDKWSENILNYSIRDNGRNTSKDIKYNGYDIIESTEWLEKFYIDQHN